MSICRPLSYPLRFMLVKNMEEQSNGPGSDTVSCRVDYHWKIHKKYHTSITFGNLEKKNISYPLQHNVQTGGHTVCVE